MFFSVAAAGLSSEHRRRIAARILPASILLAIAAASRKSSVYLFPCLRCGCDSGIVIKAGSPLFAATLLFTMLERFLDFPPRFGFARMVLPKSRRSFNESLQSGLLSTLGSKDPEG